MNFLVNSINGSLLATINKKRNGNWTQPNRAKGFPRVYGPSTSVSQGATGKKQNAESLASPGTPRSEPAFKQDSQVTQMPFEVWETLESRLAESGLVTSGIVGGSVYTITTGPGDWRL